MNGSVCSVEAMGQALIMLILRLPSRAIVSVVKTYLLICSISFLSRSKILQLEFDKILLKIFIRTIKEWFYEFWMQKELGKTPMYFLEANFLCFLWCQNLDAKFNHFINSKLPQNVSRNSSYMCDKRLNRAIK